MVILIVFDILSVNFKNVIKHFKKILKWKFQMKILKLQQFVTWEEQKTDLYIQLKNICNLAHNQWQFKTHTLPSNIKNFANNLQ